jgi:hypothetical protein
MPDILAELRAACAQVAARARHVQINPDVIPDYASALGGGPAAAPVDLDVHLTSGTREELAAFWLTLDAVNFGSGWFPTLDKREGSSGYETIALGVRERFERQGPWAAEALSQITVPELAATFGQDAGHELMELFARSLRDLGHRVTEHGDSFAAVIDDAGGSALTLVQELAGWACFADFSVHRGLPVPFLKRAQIAAADVHRAGVASFTDLGRLTMFADNLVPHVLRVDGVLEFEPQLVARIAQGELIQHGSREEVEIRACALHAVELITAARPELAAAEVDQELWLAGRAQRYKSVPRHRSRCTAY